MNIIYKNETMKKLGELGSGIVFVHNNALYMATDEDDPDSGYIFVVRLSSGELLRYSPDTLVTPKVNVELVVG